MPEGDTVYRAAQNLAAALDGEVLVKTDFRVPQLAVTDLSGRTIESVRSRGKHLLMDLGDHVVHSHLKMDGSWHLYTPQSTWKRPAHQARVVLSTADRVAVGFLLGVLEVWTADEAATALDYLGPDLLGPDWDADAAVAAVASDPDRGVAMALLDQRNLAGVGNVYANELCFVAGLHPEAPVSAIADVPRLIDRTSRLLNANSRRAMRCTTGDLRAGHELWVYGRSGRPCRRCGTRIAKGEIGEDPLMMRVSFWCPRCQPAP
ncbi:DNA-formamidopyrimidine glycosylase family protein [Solicola sp. PLA-1-18]|uniref:DNA-formamidopyrimidine glycosylase family protein n=1 Tax=Solicola sp. PLA-1-18 TaxID=3380532 RepID=UPI003B81AB6B